VHDGFGMVFFRWYIGSVMPTNLGMFVPCCIARLAKDAIPTDLRWKCSIRPHFRIAIGSVNIRNNYMLYHIMLRFLALTLRAGQNFLPVTWFLHHYRPYHGISS
jgi:hypothetical protein